MFGDRLVRRNRNRGKHSHHRAAVAPAGRVSLVFAATRRITGRAALLSGVRIVDMSARMRVLVAFLTALWLFGLIGQSYSGEAAMRYLALSLAIVAVAVWRMEPRPAPLRRRIRGRDQPPKA